MKNAMRIFAVIVILIFIGIALYWVGLSQGRSQLEAERRNFNSQLEMTNSRLVSAEYNTRLNLARFLLCRTVLELDQRNFGLANNRLNEASSVLGNINPAMVGVDQARFDALRKEIANTGINVGVNLDEQRGRVFSFGEQLEALLPRATQPAVALPSVPAAGSAAPPPAPAGQAAAPQSPAPAPK